MEETIDKKIERFKQFYLKLIEKAKSISEKGSDNVSSTILLCSIFDSLSISRFPEEKRNAVRFKSLIQKCTDWPESQRISLLHLVRAMEVSTDISDDFNKLKYWSVKELEKHLPKSTNGVHRSPGIEINIDPLASDVENIWPKDVNNKMLKIGGKELFHFKHEHMLWCYRNSVVHEYRTPGNGFNRMPKGENYPYYMSVGNIVLSNSEQINDSGNWELFYPMNFFERMCINAIDIVTRHHKQNHSSPIEMFSDGSYWIPELND